MKYSDVPSLLKTAAGGANVCLTKKITKNAPEQKVVATVSMHTNERRRLDRLWRDLKNKKITVAQYNQGIQALLSDIRSKKGNATNLSVWKALLRKATKQVCKTEGTNLPKTPSAEAQAAEELEKACQAVKLPDSLCVAQKPLKQSGSPFSKQKDECKIETVTFAGVLAPKKKPPYSVVATGTCPTAGKTIQCTFEGQCLKVPVVVPPVDKAPVPDDPLAATPVPQISPMPPEPQISQTPQELPI